MEKEHSVTIHTKSNTNWILIVMVILLLVSSLSFLYLYTKEKRAKSVDAIKQTSIESEKVMGDLSKILLIKPDDAPSIATIVDIDKLKKENAIFYADAQNGDNLVIFSKRAIIYRAGEKKIINIAPIVPSDKSNDLSKDTNSQKKDAITTKENKEGTNIPE